MKNRWVVARQLSLIAVLGSGVLAASPSRAFPNASVTFDDGLGNTTTINASSMSCTDSGTLSACSLSGGSFQGFDFNLGLNTDTDPKLFGTIDVTNTTLATQQLTVTFTFNGVGTSAIPTLNGGGLSGGATDNTGDGATIGTVAAGALYAALIDNVSYQTLNGFPFSFTQPNPFESGNFTDVSFGPNQAGPAITNSIAIQLQFTLTPQDSASFSGTFESKPVPEPGTALLLGLGFIWMARRERR